MAYADGLLSRETFVYRLDQLLEGRLVDPPRLVGDLTFRRRRQDWRAAVTTAVAAVRQTLIPSRERSLLLALDWSGQESELVLGRHHDCDVVLTSREVSRRHASLFFRDGSWVLQDLESTNGTTVNGARVGRCEVRPGDLLVLGDERLTID